MTDKKKSEKPIEEEISEIEAGVTKKVASEAKDSIFIEGWGTFYRRNNGNLVQGDMEQYEIVMEEERNKEVNPLRDNAVSPFG